MKNWQDHPVISHSVCSVFAFGLGFAAMIAIDQVYGVERISKYEMRDFQRLQTELDSAHSDNAELSRRESLLKEDLDSERQTNADLRVEMESQIAAAAEAAATNAQQDEQNAVRELSKCRSSFKELERSYSSINETQRRMSEAAATCQDQLQGLKVNLRDARAQANGGVEIPEFQDIQLRISYRPTRAGDANAIAKRLGGHFKSVSLSSCGLTCGNGTQLQYGESLTHNHAFTLSRLLMEMDFSEFKNPLIERDGFGLRVYLY